MTKDREIVLMLIKRKRDAYRRWLEYERSAKKSMDGSIYLHSEYLVIANACEHARRILYGHEL